VWAVKVSKPISNKFQNPGQIGSKPYLVVEPAPAERIFGFDSYRLDTAQRVLSRDGVSVPLTPKAFDLLLLLIENQGRLVSKDRLMETIWPDTYVEEKTLAQNVFTLRKTLGLALDGQSYIETVPKHGYRFHAEVTETVRPVELPQAPASTSYPVPMAGTSATMVAALPGGLEQRPPATQLIGRWSTLKRVVFVATCLVVVAGLAFAALRFATRHRPGLANAAFQKFDISRLTNSGQVTAVGLSPDGKFVAFAAGHNGSESLFLRQIDPDTTVEIVPAAAVNFRGITFAPGGGWIYFVTTAPGSFTGTLFKVPMLGGGAQKVTSGSVDSRVALSPDGKRFAFMRWVDNQRNAIWVANADGTGERQLAALSNGSHFNPAGPAWSPDGKSILSGTENLAGGGAKAGLTALDTSTGSAHELNAGEWNWIGQTAWLADGSGFTFTAWNPASETMSDQIWLMTYPSGVRRRITSDIDGYLGVDVSADARTIVATASAPDRALWVAPAGDVSRAAKISSGAGELYTDHLGLNWMPDGRVIGSSKQGGGKPQIVITAGDGSAPRPLTNDPSANYQPVVSADGRYIAFISDRTGIEQLWRMDPNGENAVLASPTRGVRSPSLPSDGQWIVYEGNVPSDPTIWRVPVGGGDPIQVSKERAYLPAVSPDGKTIACLFPTDDQAVGKLTLLDFTDGHLVKQFDRLVSRKTPALVWSPDGRTVTYIVSDNATSNVWGQLIDGGAPRAITSWTSDQIYRFAWSRDGRLLCERGSTLTDVILIRGRSDDEEKR
jgi:Tol biopolymer transport system component/DNA-binding winged helix-turn-helix (wHTH) protein